ncbi:MAG TPA: hypothetical protein PK954_09190 [Anaerolineales bacterium]|nr:hypothetical protein [Anaerolineales bacterium]
MSSSERSVWGFHAGRTGDANSLFLENNCVAIGWDKMGDLSKIGANREAFKSAILEAYPDTKPAAVPLGRANPFDFCMK